MGRGRDFWHMRNRWSAETFGLRSQRGPTGPLLHLRKEVEEALQETNPQKRRMEIVDCLFLTLDAAWRDGMDYEELYELAFEKLQINRKRKWQRPTVDGPVEHVRGEDE